MVYDASSTRCFTLKAALNVQYRGSMGESNLVEDYIQSIVHTQIAIDPTQLYVMDVIGLQWSKPVPISEEETLVEQQPPRDNTLPPSSQSPDPTPSPAVSSTSSLSSSSSPVGPIEIIIPVATGVFLILLWIGAHFYRRHMQKQNNRKTASLKQASKENGIDVETGSVTTAPTISPTNSGPELHRDSEFDSVDLGTPSKDHTGDVVVSTPLQPQTPTSKQRQHGSDTIAISKSMPVSVDSPERHKPDGGATAIFKSVPVSVDSPDRSAAGLPPRPPRRNSMKLKKRRKRKKKKKIVALKRVNSRENINEMPVISESEDEESERGSECDSEYTSDDGSCSSYDASSGYNTPARSRSLSRTSSRASSPQLSPQDEMFAADVFDHDVEFVIEAPDFPNLLDREERDSPRNPDLLSRMLSRKTNLLGEQQQRFIEIEPRPNSDDSMVDENDSPKRRIPLPWLN